MENIDKYIKQTLNMKSSDHSSRSGTSAYRFGDVILVKYGWSRKDEENLAISIDEAVKKGAQTPRHLDIKREGDICWVLQETAKGQNKLWESEIGEYYCNLIKSPDEHYKKLIKTVQELYDFGLEIRSENIFYDKDEGFTIIDLLRPPNKECDLSNKKDIEELISMSDSSIFTLLPYNTYKRDLISRFVTYRVLKMAERIIPNINDLPEHYKNIYNCSYIFEEFNKRINDLVSISFSDIEDIANTIYDEYPESRELLRRK